MNSIFCASVPASHESPAFSHLGLPSFACLHYREGNFPQKSEDFLLDNSNIHYVELRNKAPRGKKMGGVSCLVHSPSMEGHLVPPGLETAPLALCFAVELRETALLALSGYIQVERFKP